MVDRNDLKAVKAITMLVESGATENFVNNEFIPEAESLMLDYTVFDKAQENSNRRATAATRNRNRHSPRRHH